MSERRGDRELYPWHSSAPSHSCAYLAPVVLQMCQEIGARSVLDLGAGNGALARVLCDAGFEVVGVEPEQSGVEQARKAVPGARFMVGSVYDDPIGDAKFDVVVSTEVIEHLFLPRALPQYARAVLRPGGYLVLSTPYFGYWKNLGLSILNRWDRVHSPMWDGGHVKFWSKRTLVELLRQEGFTCRRFAGAGRIPYLWKSMVVLGQDSRKG